MTVIDVGSHQLCEVYVSQLLCNAATWDNTDAKDEIFPKN